MRIWIFLYALAAVAQPPTAGKLELHSVRAEPAEYQGKHATRVTPTADVGDNETYAVVPGLEIQDGTIEAEVAGTVAPGSFEGARGFIGIAFRVQAGPKFELFYLRPTNGRADDQLRRNHSTQYVSVPGWPWERTRRETPGLYESYVDLQPGVWTPVKIVVSGTQARLYVNGATQPALIVNDLKQGAGKGGVGLWVGPGTEGYFANVRVGK
jgi:hypothetical protein